MSEDQHLPCEVRVGALEIVTIEDTFSLEVVEGAVAVTRKTDAGAEGGRRHVVAVFPLDKVIRVVRGDFTITKAGSAGGRTA